MYQFLPSDRNILYINIYDIGLRFGRALSTLEVPHKVHVTSDVSNPSSVSGVLDVMVP